MPKRTMTVSRLWAHEFRKPANILPLPTLPDGRDLLDAFEQHARSSMTTGRVASATETYSRVTKVEKDRRCLTITFSSGRYGEDGVITDVRTGRTKGAYSRTDATAVVTHGVLLVPKTGESALAFVERSGGFGGMTHLVETFVEKFDGTYPDHRLKRETVVQSDAWLKRARLMQVTGTIRKYRSDIANDGVDEVLGTMKHVVVPEGKTKYFPRPILAGLLNRKINRAKFLGFPDEGGPDEVDITVGDGDQEKTFEIDNEKTPSLRLVLSGNGEAAPTATKIRRRVLSEAPALFKHYDVDWDTQ